MSISIPQQLETKRLILRILTDEDENEFNAILTKQNLSKSTILNQVASHFQGISDFFRNILKSYNSQKPVIIFRLIYKINQEFIGICGIIPDFKATTQCFYFLLPPFQKNGYALEALKRLLEYSFQYKIKKVIAMISPQNSEAWKVAERSGMMYMGEYEHKMLYEIEKRDFLNQNKY